MNQDQITSLIRSIVKSLGASAIAKGYGDDSLWEAITGLAILGFGLWWSHQTHASPPSQPPASSGSANISLGLFLCCICAGLLSGCGTTDHSSQPSFPPAVPPSAPGISLRLVDPASLIAADASLHTNVIKVYTAPNAPTWLHRSTNLVAWETIASFPATNAPAFYTNVNAARAQYFIAIVTNMPPP